MKFHFLFLSTLLFSASANASIEQILQNKLQVSINTYSAKIDTCEGVKNENSVEDLDVKSFKSIIKDKPRVLSYLASSAFDNCLQPERALLAEAILNAETQSKHSPTFILADTTRKLTFSSDFEDEKAFADLTQEQRSILSAVEVFDKPFDAMTIFDRIIHD